MQKSSSLKALLVSILAYAALWLLAPKVHFLPKALLLILGTVAFMAVQIAIVYYYSLLNLKWWQSLLILAGSLGLTALVVMFMSAHARPHQGPIAYYGALRMVMSVLIMIAAASIGCAVAVRVKDRNLLLPVVMLAACIDFWTVTRGPVATMLQRAPQIAKAVSVPIPAAGAGVFTPLVAIGPGDFLFMGLVFAAISRLKMNGPRNYWFVFKMMTLGMLFVVAGPLQFLPALVLLAIAVVSANWREFKLNREEKLSIVVVAAILFAFMWLASSALAPAQPKGHHHAKPKPAAAADSNRTGTNGVRN